MYRCLFLFLSGSNLVNIGLHMIGKDFFDVKHLSANFVRHFKFQLFYRTIKLDLLF
jgi:hypothetical protein